MRPDPATEQALREMGLKEPPKPGSPFWFEYALRRARIVDDALQGREPERAKDV